MFKINEMYTEKSFPNTTVRLIGVDHDRSEVHYKESQLGHIRSISFTEWTANFKPTGKDVSQTGLFRQKELREWQQKNFGGTDSTGKPEWCLIGAMEELGELSHAILKRKQKIRGYDSTEKYMSEVTDAICDTIVYLSQLATVLGINLDEEYNKVVDTVLKRNWKENKNTG